MRAFCRTSQVVARMQHSIAPGKSHDRVAESESSSGERNGGLGDHKRRSIRVCGNRFLLGVQDMTQRAMLNAFGRTVQSYSFDITLLNGENELLLQPRLQHSAPCGNMPPASVWTTLKLTPPGPLEVLDRPFSSNK